MEEPDKTSIIKTLKSLALKALNQYLDSIGPPPKTIIVPDSSLHKAKRPTRKQKERTSLVARTRYPLRSMFKNQLPTIDDSHTRNLRCPTYKRKSRETDTSCGFSKWDVRQLKLEIGTGIRTGATLSSNNGQELPKRSIATTATTKL